MMGRSSEGMVGGLVSADRQQRPALQKIPRSIATKNPCPLSLPWCKLYLVDTIVLIGQNTFYIHINTWLKSNIVYAEWLVILQISFVTYNSYISHIHHVCAAEDWWLN